LPILQDATARKGPDIIKKEIGLEINYDNKNETKKSSSAGIFAKLKICKDGRRRNSNKAAD